MNNQFCKVFDFDNNQILVRKKESEKSFNLVLETWIDGIEIEFVFPYSTKEFCNEVFEKIQKDKAKEIINEMAKPYSI